MKLNIISRMKVWQAKKIQARIDRYENYIFKYEQYIKKIKGWLKQDKKKFKKVVQSMDEDTLLIYGQEIGQL